jgi:glutaconate CoA-transferase subunit A
VWIGRRRELATMAHAATTTFATVEAVYDGDLLADEATAAGILPALYIGAVAVAERGAWPLGLPGLYAADDAEIARYAAAARSDAGFAQYLDEAARQAA